MAISTISKWFGRGESDHKVCNDEIQYLSQANVSLQKELRRAENVALEQSNRAERLQAEVDAIKKGTKQLRKAVTDITAQHATSMQQQRYDFMLKIAELQTRVIALTAARDTAQANFEWARLMFNKGEEERAILTSRVLERQVQAFTIDREPVTQTPPAEPGPARPTDRPIPPTGDVVEQAIGGLANRFGVLFEDVGDEEAKRMGLDDATDIAP